MDCCALVYLIKIWQPYNIPSVKEFSVVVLGYMVLSIIVLLVFVFSYHTFFMTFCHCACNLKKTDLGSDPYLSSQVFIFFF